MTKKITIAFLIIFSFLGLFSIDSNIEGTIYFMELGEGEQIYNMLYFDSDSTYTIYIYEIAMTYYGNYSVSNDVIHFYNEHTADNVATEKDEFDLVINHTGSNIYSIGSFINIPDFIGKDEIMNALDSRDDIIEIEVIDRVFEMNKSNNKVE